jgi:hypothetical protein
MEVDYRKMTIKLSEGLKECGCIDKIKEYLDNKVVYTNDPGTDQKILSKTT